MARIDPAKLSQDAREIILQWDVAAAAKRISELNPDIWRRMCPKSYDAPGSFYPSRSLAVGLTAGIHEIVALNRYMDSNLGYVAGILEKHNFPIYYVSEKIMQAMQHTRILDRMTWEEIALPFPAMCFMLPRGTLKEPAEVGGNDIILAGVCRFQQGEHLSIPTVGKSSIQIPEDRMCTFWLIGPSALTSNDCTFPSTVPIASAGDLIDRKTEEANREYYGPGGEFSARISGLVANFILLMDARKDLVERERPAFKNRRTGAVVYRPNFIGRNYRIAYTNDPGRAARSHFTELGWRCGHFKAQRHGPGRENVKTIWVAPYIAHTSGLVPAEEVSR